VALAVPGGNGEFNACLGMPYIWRSIMKICIAQTESIKGDIQRNIKSHLDIIRRAIHLEADLIIFPELSITGYEPLLASRLATHPANRIFDPFQAISNQYKITIGVGMPVRTIDGITISMFIFQPNTEVVVYSKQILHADELPYFVCGTCQTILHIKGKKIAIGICYETLQRSHFVESRQNGAELYIASVAKPKEGIIRAYDHFAKISKEFGTPILMSNCIGYCDNFMSQGQSAAWNSHGELVAHLDSTNEGILIYETALETAQTYPLNIDKGQVVDLDALWQIYINGKNHLAEKGINQWTDQYPTRLILKKDIDNQTLYILKSNKDIIGAIVLDEIQDPEYTTINWLFDDKKILVIHRLVIDPIYQGRGYAQKLLNYGEDFAEAHGYTSIRLDVYSEHNQVIEFYKRRNYHIRGKVHFPGRQYPFYCMEKEISAKRKL
jgi:predicted amidohydrolase/GNAT superfamily N-acetyltransferase